MGKRKALVALAVALAALATTIVSAKPALASNGYVCEGRVAYKDCGDHMEVWDYCDPGLTSRPDGDAGAYIYIVEQQASEDSNTIVDWDYSPTFFGNYKCPWRFTIANADRSRMWTRTSATGTVEIAPHTITPEPNTGTDLVIPSHVNGKPVTAMRVQAFGSPDSFTDDSLNRDRDCTATSIDLSATSITRIPDRAFNVCKSIVEVKLPDSVAHIGKYAFGSAYEHTGVPGSTLKRINVPKSLKTVDPTAFGNCSKSIQAQFAKFTTQSSGSGTSGSTSTTATMYRLYNPNSGEHFYTSNAAERDSVKNAGWTYEGVGWTAPKSGSPVYRLYNEYGGEHHYTMNKGERDSLVRAGWKDEGIGWYSGGSKPLYRQYNPNAFANNHNYTPSTNERDTLLGLGWRNEGIAWYGI